MTNSIFPRVTYDGTKNAVFTVSGILNEDLALTDLLLFSSLKNPIPKALRIESVTFAIQEKMGFNLFWVGDEDRLILPLESRGRLDFEGVQGVHSPEGAQGIAFASFKCDGVKTFLIILDFTKQT